MTWRARAKAVIADVIRREGASDMKRLRAALRDAYPFGQRAMWPYKVWCDEVRAALGLKKPKIVAQPKEDSTLFLEYRHEQAAK